MNARCNCVEQLRVDAGDVDTLAWSSAQLGVVGDPCQPAESIARRRFVEKNDRFRLTYAESIGRTSSRELPQIAGTSSTS